MSAKGWIAGETSSQRGNSIQSLISRETSLSSVFNHKMSYESSDDDYELPSLSERILQISKAQKQIQPDVFNKENKNSESLASPQKISNTPAAPNVVFERKSSDSEDDDSFSNICERLDQICTPGTKTNKKLDILSDSEDEAEFLKFSEIIRNTPRNTHTKKLNRISDSEDEPAFLKPSEVVHNSPHTPNPIKPSEISDSEDESEFLKFAERIRNTPCIPYISKSKESDSEDDSVFSNRHLSKVYASKSENKGVKKKPRSYLLSHVPEKQKLFSDSTVLTKRDQLSHTGLSALKPIKTIAQTKYDSLFPAEMRTEKLTSKNRESYAKQLYNFFNKYIFGSKLPETMRLTWENALLRTAGQTHCYRENSTYSCYISLSVKILTSFDHLQDTLLHEMCHAAVWIISETMNEKHGPLWKTWAARCHMIIPSIECPTRCHNYDVPKRVSYRCNNCSYEVKRLKRSQKLEMAKCPKCKIPLVLYIL